MVGVIGGLVIGSILGAFTVVIVTVVLCEDTYVGDKHEKS